MINYIYIYHIYVVLQTFTDIYIIHIYIYIYTAYGMILQNTSQASVGSNHDLGIFRIVRIGLSLCHSPGSQWGKGYDDHSDHQHGSTRGAQFFVHWKVSDFFSNKRLQHRRRLKFLFQFSVHRIVCLYVVCTSAANASGLYILYKMTSDIKCVCVYHFECIPIHWKPICHATWCVGW